MHAMRRRPTRSSRRGYFGDDLSIAFNPNYLLDGLTAMDCDTTKIAFTEPGKPALLTGKPGLAAAMDSRMHTRFPRWIAESIARNGARTR
jgi:hypothetical protein